MKYIKHYSLVVLITLLLPHIARAKVVDSTEALQIATNFYQESTHWQLGGDVLQEVWNSSQMVQSGVATIGVSACPTFYVFVPKSGMGFVVVSGDDSTLPILGYSFIDAPDFNNMPCNLKWWCEAMNSEISQLRESDSTVTTESRQKKISTTDSSEIHLETALWNQSEPYNTLCPMEEDGYCLTGCVPTALSIIMRYHQYPSKGYGETEAYEVEKNGVFVDSRNLEHKYDWNNMLLDYSDSYTDTQASAVATLMYDIGCVLQAEYGKDGTGAVITSVRKTYQIYEHFAYSPKMLWQSCEYYSEEDWNEFLREELNINGPILYRGDGLTSSHAFVVDGYEDNFYFHINWGWGGHSNGYYLLPNITYNINQKALANFIPDDGSEAEPIIQVHTPGLILDTEVINPYEYFHFTDLRVINNSIPTFSGAFRCALTDSEGNVKEWISSEYTYEGLLSSVRYHWATMQCGITVGILENDRIRMFYKLANSDEWRLMGPDASDCVWEIVLTADMIGNREPECLLQMHSPGMSVDTEVFTKGESFLVTDAYVSNVSMIAFIGHLRFALTDSVGNIKEWISDTITRSTDLPPNTYIHYSNKNCIITTDINVGDRIRMFYQVANSDEWKLITSKEEDVVWEIVVNNVGISDIESITTDTSYVKYIYTLDGQKINSPQKGVNILRYNNGMTKKVMYSSPHNQKP